MMSCATAGAVDLEDDLAMPSASDSAQVLKSGGVGGRGFVSGSGVYKHTSASRDAGATT